MYRALIAIVLWVGCVDTAEAPAPSADELADLDAWAAASDGKADLPNVFGETVAWLEDVYTNKMSAIWHEQEHPASATAAIARIRALLGTTDPTQLTFRTTVQRLRTPLLDHSEIDIVLPGAHVIRLVGDPKGAGAFVDGKVFETTLSNPLCLTWTELQTAVTAAYAPGHYAVDFVCHTITERVLRALHIGSGPFSSQIHTYQAARFVWGPLWPSGDSNDPHAWPESRTCH